MLRSKCVLPYDSVKYCRWMHKNDTVIVEIVCKIQWVHFHKNYLTTIKYSIKCVLMFPKARNSCLTPPQSHAFILKPKPNLKMWLKWKMPGACVYIIVCAHAANNNEQNKVKHINVSIQFEFYTILGWNIKQKLVRWWDEKHYSCWRDINRL